MFGLGIDALRPNAYLHGPFVNSSTEPIARMSGEHVYSDLNSIQPVDVRDSELGEWSESRPLAFDLALFLARFAPRGRGWFPRMIGQRFCRKMKLVVRTAFGAKLAVDPRSLDYYTLMLNEGGVDPHVRDACVRVLHPGNVFYDIGANAGLIAIDVAKALDGRVRVFAFEPQHGLAFTAAVSGRLNALPDWHVYEVMLGREAGVAELFIPDSTVHASAISRQSGAQRVSCRMVTLDFLVESKVIPPPQVIKIDVEGAERDVFAGASQTIRTHAPSIIFEADVNMRRFGYTRADLFEQLSSLVRYRFFFIRGSEFIPVDRHFEDPSFTDLIAVPESTSAATN